MPALGLRSDGWTPVSLAANAEGVCAEIMLKLSTTARWRPSWGHRAL